MYDLPVWDDIQLGIGAVVVGIVAILLLLRLRDVLTGKSRQPEPSFPPLIAAVMMRDRAQVEQLLATGERLHQRDDFRRTALHYAVLENDTDLARLCIERGIAVDAVDINGHTALHFAAQEYLPELARLLIDNGADVNAVDVHGNSVLARAVFDSRGRGKIIALLLNYGADPNMPNNHGKSAIELARTIANYDIEQFFELEDQD